MRLLRSHALSEKQLGVGTGLQPERLGVILDLLEAIGYVERREGSTRSLVPVLDSSDLELMREIRIAGRSIMAAWHEQNYEPLRARLSHLTPLRNGVPFKRVYTEVWHYIFGIANRTLVEAGLFADPYAAGRRFTGYLPAIWANGLGELT